MYSNSIHPRFDITTLETLERDFAKAKAESYEKDNGWTWLNIDIHLYLSCKNRLLKQIEKSESETRKNKRAKK